MLLGIPKTIIESLSTTDSLTLNEKVVISALGACLLLHCGKMKFCPKAWGFTDKEMERKLIAQQLAKSAFEELDEDKRPQADEDDDMMFAEQE